ncbi:MAG: D-aminoacylase [Anaerolineae bacterium]|nr:D-aminoacylase [Anaerolineae bacterium]
MTSYDTIIRNGLIYDGSGGDPYPGDVALQGDRIAAVGNVGPGGARVVIDAHGQAVAPGFINMLSWANVSLIHDGRSQSDIRQGVTLEVLGENFSMGPLNDAMKAQMLEDQGDVKYAVEWTTLGEYLDYLVKRGVACNVTSFVGSESVRIHELGYANRRPTPDELDRMRALVRQAMEEGAVGLSSALIYAPASYADTDELVALAEIVAEYEGLYISHIRSEGDAIFEALDEFFTICREASVRGEIYHLKLSGKANWDKYDEFISRIEAARASGLPVTADMYTYRASSTGLDATLPGWVHEGGHRALVERLRDPALRPRILDEMTRYKEVDAAEDTLLVGFRSEALKHLRGQTLAEVAAARNLSPQETVLDLIVEDDSRVQAVFFSMSEDNVRRQMALPWVSFDSDAGSYSAEGLFLKRSTHPRAYGTFARVLGKYVRDEGVVPLADAVRRLTSLPARVLKIDRRGLLKPGYFADVVIFDAATIQDHATYHHPHQYATGVHHVFVNGVQVLKDGDHTGAAPGRVVRGPGWR